MSDGDRPTQEFVNKAWVKLLAHGDSSDWDLVVEAARAGSVVYTASRLNLTLRATVGPDTGRLLARITQLRVDAGSPTLGEIAEALKMNDATLSRFFNGIGSANWPTTAAIIAYLGGDPESFVVDWQAARREPKLKR